MIETTFEEYKALLNMTYKEAVSHLKSKYGGVTDDYFTEDGYQRFLDDKIKTPTKGKYTRTKDGLYAYHICENEFILLSTLDVLKQLGLPFWLQKKENLVYCNLFEHAILHVLIWNEREPTTPFKVGIGDYVNFMRPELELWYIDGEEPNIPWKQNCYKASYLPKDEATTLINLMDEKVVLN